MRIAIIACDHFKRELEALTAGDEDFVHREYLEYELHEKPKDLKARIIEKIQDLAGKVDAVLIGYAVCGSLKNIENEVDVPSARFQADDCVGVYLTQEVYSQERRKGHTYFSTPYFSDMDMEWHERDWKSKLGPAAEGIDAKEFIVRLFDSYTRTLYVHTIGEREPFEVKAKKFADDLSLSYESTEGTLRVMEEAIERVKEKAREAKKRD
jgi:hypothetical protein